MGDFDEIRQQMDLLSDEELLSIVREHDEEQWRPEVFDIVRAILNERGKSRDVAAAEVSGSAEAKGLVLAEPPESGLVQVASYPAYVDAETDRLALASKGIDAWVFDAGPWMGNPSGILLKVRDADWRAAVEALDPEVLQPVPSSDLPDEIAEPPCPKCGSRNVMESAEIVEDPAAPQAWMYHCASCGHKWSES